MPHRSMYGGRHELGQNFLTHRPTIARIIDLVAATEGPILEIGAGSGALTIPLAALNRPLRAIDIDEHRITRLRRRLPAVDVAHVDALCEPIDRPIVVGNLPFHITTPLIRRMIRSPAWKHGIVLTQWEVARKRAGVGGSTMMTAQAAPWFVFELHARVPARGFTPPPSVDAGLLAIHRRDVPLVQPRQRRCYERFVREVFTSRGHGIGGILRARRAGTPAMIEQALSSSSLTPNALPRDLSPEQWAALWHRLGNHPSAARTR